MTVRITLALGGGGVKCYAQIGVIDALQEAGIEIAGMAASSGGALVAALYASGRGTGEILDIVRGIDIQRLSRHTRADRAALFGLRRWEPVLARLFGTAGIQDLPIPLAFPCVDLRSNREVELTEGLLVDALLAAIAIPGLYPAQPRGEWELIDGGVLTPVPVASARRLSPECPGVAVALIPPYSEWSAHPFPQLMHAIPFLRALHRLRYTQALGQYVRAADLTNRMLAELRMQAEAPDFIIRPAVNHLGLFDKIALEEIVSLGRAAAEKMIPEILACAT
jgi:NTE family protein